MTIHGLVFNSIITITWPIRETRKTLNFGGILNSGSHEKRDCIWIRYPSRADERCQVTWEVWGSFENTAGPNEQVSVSIIRLMAVFNEDGKGV